MQYPPLRWALATTLLLLAACGEQPTEPLSDPRGLILLSTVAYPGDIYVMRPDGSGLRQLTKDSMNDVDPSWAPDGKHIVFSRAPTGGDRWADLYIMNADGSQKRLLYHGAGPAYLPRWSPDGSRIAFARADSVVGLRVYVMNADGSGARLVTPAASTAPDWTPDGSRLLFLATRPERPALSIYTIRPDGTDERLVGGDVACVKDVHDATWSPDGTRIAYRCSDAPDYIIRIIRADGTSPVQLSFVDTAPSYGVLDFSPVWSPDGARIAFGSTRVSYHTAPWVMDTTGANASPIGGQAAQGLVPVDWEAVPR